MVTLVIQSKTSNNLSTIEFNNVKVYYEAHHHGGGIRWAPEFLKIFSNSLELKNKKFDRALELCCGPGFIGFNLLGAGIIHKLALSDINPAVEENIKKTVVENKISKIVEPFYLSDGLESVKGSFDLIVSNPPHIDVKDPTVPALNFQDPPILYSDPNFNFHKNLFKTLPKKLKKGGILLLLENRKYSPPTKLLGKDFAQKNPQLDVDLQLPCGHPDFYFIKLSSKIKK